ncbi:MAG: M16 family metallopeptidase [Gemmatimonadota bacterium]
MIGMPGRAALLAAAALLVASPATGQSDDGIFPFPYHRIDLDNGFRAYFIRAGAPGQIAYVSMVRTGSRDEVEKGKTGFAHFFEHMMFRGTKKYPNYDGITESMGAARNAFTSLDMTVYYLVAGSEYLDQIADLESDRFQRLDYSEDGFRTEAGAVLGEYQNNAYSPFAVLDRKLRELAWTRHTYRHSTIGFEADVRAMPQGFEYSREFFRRFYRPENVVLVIAGDFDWDHAEEVVRKYYSDWAPGYQAPDIPVEPEQTEPRIATVEYDGRTLPILSVNWKGPAWSPTDRLAVATEILGEIAFGPNSDLYKKLVLEEQRVQFLQPGFDLSRDPDLVGVTTMVSDPADVDAVRSEIMATVARFRNDPVDPHVLDVTKQAAKYGFLMGLETAQSVAFSLIQPIIDTGTLEAVNDYYATLESITPDDIREAARRFLVDRGLVQVTLVQSEGQS